MKNLKIKFGLFSLLAILVVSVFLTSCEQENIVSPISETPLLQGDLQNTYYLFPVGITENVISTYLNSIYEETTRKLEENYRISRFLEIEGKFEEVWDDMVEGQHLSDINLEHYLSDNQIDRLETYKPSPIIEFRETCGWHFWSKSHYNGGWCIYEYAYYCRGVGYDGVQYSTAPTAFRTHRDPC